MYKIAVLSKIKSHSDAADYFKELSFYNKPIKKPKVKRLKNINRLAELYFYEQLSVIKTDRAFKEYAMPYKVEISEGKDPVAQLEASKLSIKDLLNDLLNETKGFMYQITVKVLLKKYEHNGEIEFAPVYFNSLKKTVINHRFRLENYFQEILYMIDIWINNGPGSNVESIEPQYINISTYRPLSGRFYMDLPVQLRNPRKGLINIKNKDKEYFLWSHVRHIDPSKEQPERIKETDKKIAEKLDYDGIEFPMQEKDFNKIEVKSNICINVFGCENNLVFPIYISDQKFENSIDLLLLMMINHIVCTSKILTDLCFTKQNIKTKNGFVEVACSVLVVKMC